MTPTGQHTEQRTPPPASTPTRAPWWLLPLLLATVLAGMIGFRFARRPTVTVVQSKVGPTESAVSSSLGPTDAVTGEAVSLVVDFGNGVQQRFAALDWQAEMTVLDLMLAAAKFRPGIEFHVMGAGESAFLTNIAGIENGAGDGRFWQFWVNDSRSDRSFGVYPLKPGDDVLWKFALQE